MKHMFVTPHGILLLYLKTSPCTRMMDGKPTCSHCQHSRRDSARQSSSKSTITIFRHTDLVSDLSINTVTKRDGERQAPHHTHSMNCTLRRRGATRSRAIVGGVSPKHPNRGRVITCFHIGSACDSTALPSESRAQYHLSSVLCSASLRLYNRHPSTSDAMWRKLHALL